MNIGLSVLITRLPFLIIFFLLGLFSPNFLKKDVYFGSIVPEHLKNTNEIKAIGRLYKKTYLAVCGPYTILFAIFMFFNNNSKYFTNGLVLFSILWIIIYFYTHSKVQIIIENSLKIKTKGHQNKISPSKKYTPSVGISKDKYIANPIWFLIPIFLIILNIILCFKYYNSIPQNIIIAWNFKEKAIFSLNKSVDIVLIYPIVQLTITMLFQYFYKLAGSIENVSKPTKVFLTGFVEFLDIYLILLTSLSFFRSMNILNISPMIVPVMYMFSLIFIPLIIFIVYARVK